MHSMHFLSIAKQMENYETKKMLKLYVLSLPLLRKNGAFFLLTIPQALIKKNFLMKFQLALILGKYDDIILAGDLNIDESRFFKKPYV